jgi:hypothetical protein
MWNLVNNEVVADIFYPFGLLNQDIRAPRTNEENIGPIRFNYIKSFKYFNKEYSLLYMGKPCFADTPKFSFGVHFAELVPPTFLLKYSFFNHFVEFPTFHNYCLFFF